MAVATTALAVYVATLAPGLIAITDTPKFQFIGRILGTAHPPGYPLYVILSHLFGYLPIGSLAYRINLMSAVLTAGACALIYRCARLLGNGRFVASLAVLAFAFGSAVWYVSTIAEVYALNLLLVSAALLMALGWRQSQRSSLFFGGVAMVALALGNHTTAVFLIPALGLFACFVAPRFALRPSTILLSALIVFAGLTQYLFILVRTHAGAWGEAPASNLSELFRVMTGSEYFTGVMPGGLTPVLHTTLPLILWTSLQELTPGGVALACLGVIALWRRQKSALILLVTAAIPYVVFASVYTPQNPEVFLVPAFLVFWLLAASGGERAIETVAVRAGRRGGVAVMAILALLPAWQIARNYQARDLSHRRADMRFFDALFDRLPEGSALVHEDFLIDRMVYYKTLGERAAEGRRLLALLPADPEPIAAASRGGYRVFAFPGTANLMRLMFGAEFGYSPLDLSSAPIRGYLEDLPRGTIVAIAIPARHLGSFAPNGRLLFETIGISRNLGGLVMSVAAIGRRGSRSGSTSADRRGAAVTLEAEHPSSGSVPAPIVARADLESAAIEYGGREIIRSEDGMAVATWRDGRLTAAFSVPASTRLAPTLPTGYMVYPLLAVRQRQAIGADPVDMTSSTPTGSFVYGSTGRSRLVLYAGGHQALAPNLLECSSPRWPTLDVTSFAGTSARDALERALREDQFPLEARLRAMPYVHRIAIDAQWAGRQGVRVGLGGVPVVAYGRLGAGGPGLVYGVDVSTHLTPIEERTMALEMANHRHSDLVGTGWSPVHADGIGPYRETIERRASLLIPVQAAAALRIGVQLLSLPGAPPDSPVSVTLEINRKTLASVAVQPRWHRYWWEVRDEAVSSGINDLALTVSPTGRRIAVSDLLIRRE